MPLTDTEIQTLIQELADSSHQFSEQAFERIKDVAQQLLENPFIQPQVDLPIEDYFDELQTWTATALATAYAQALREVDDIIDTPLSSTVPSQSVIMDDLPPATGNIPKAAKEILDEYPEHWTMFNSFRKAAIGDLEKMRPFIIRDVNDKIRSLAVEATQSSFLESDTFTRKTLTQDILNNYANNGITGVTYSDGRTMRIDSYSRLVARNQVNNAARHATITRAQQHGVNEVVASVHFPCSDLCLDEQGEVWSIAQPSDYPPLSQAIANGFFHSLCKHSVSPWIEGITEKPEIDEEQKAVNAERYKITQKLRYLERNKRKWLRRKEAAITDEALQKATKHANNWNDRIRELVNDNDWLRRSPERERIF